MAFSYTGNPGSSPKDLTRFLLGDTDECKPLLQDGEIDYMLNVYNQTPMNAAIRLCETIIAKFSRLSDESVGQVRISYSQRAKGYRELKRDLIARLSTEDAAPYAGGVWKSDVRQNAQNCNRVRPDFTGHMMQNYQISPWVSGAWGSSLAWWWGG